MSFFLRFVEFILRFFKSLFSVLLIDPHKTPIENYDPEGLK